MASDIFVASGLPPEIFYKIIGFFNPSTCDRTTLVNLCLIPGLDVIAQQILYRRVAFSGYLDKKKIGHKSYIGDSDEEDTFGWVSKISKLDGFLAILSTRPLATHIHEFSCVLGYEARNWPAVDHGIRQMFSLKCLRITVMGDNTGFLPDDLLKPYPFQLEHLCWLDYRREADPNIHTYATFISSHRHHLTHLQFATRNTWDLTGGDGGDRTLSIHCPHLQTLVGDFFQVGHLRQGGAPSTAAVCIYAPGDPQPQERHLQAMSSIFSNLRVLVVYPWFVQGQYLELVMTSLAESLEVFQIVIREFGVISNAGMDAREVMAFIPLLTRLRTFIWSCHLIGDTRRGFITYVEQREFARSWFLAMPLLTAVYFSVFDEERNIYLRWSPPSPRTATIEVEGVLVTSDEFRYETPFSEVTLDRRLSFVM